MHARHHPDRFRLHLRAQRQPQRFRPGRRRPRYACISIWKRRAPHTKPAAVPALQAFLETLQRVYGTRRHSHRRKGRDLLTGQDRSDLVTALPPAPRPALLPVSAKPPLCARIRRRPLLVLLPSRRAAPSRSWFLTPDHLFFWLGARCLLCYWLALHLTSPVRALQKAVERFGHGDLSARAQLHAPR